MKLETVKKIGDFVLGRKFLRIIILLFCLCAVVVAICGLSCGVHTKWFDFNIKPSANVNINKNL